MDTLDASGTAYGRMWGGSPQDIWLTSSGVWEKSFAHFDGVNWNYFGLPKMLPYSIYGFNSTNIIVGGNNGSIWHYDGTSWNRIGAIIKDGRSDIWFDNVWGESEDDFFATGAHPDENGIANISVVAQFLRNEWIVHDTRNIYGIVERIFKNNPDNKYYIQAIGGRNFTDSTKIYEFLPNGKSIPLYSDLWTKGKQADISLIDGQVFFVMGNRIATRENNTFKTVLNVDNPNFYQRLWGRSSKDLFLLMTDGLVHYNGSNLEYLFYFNFPDKKPWTQIFGAALFEEHVFFLVSEANPSLNLIYKGTLK